MKLNITRFRPAEYNRQIWQCAPEHGTAFEELSRPDYWSHISAKLRPTDRIEVNAEDGSYFAEFIVLDAGRYGAKLALLRRVDIEVSVKTEDVETHEIKWGGPHDKFRVIRKSDKKVVKEGLTSKNEAAAWLDNHLKAMAA